MNTYERVKAWVEVVFAANNVVGWTIVPGPQLPENPDATIVLTRYGGSGMNTDGAMDGRSWQFRIIGKQQDYASAESVAELIDHAALSHHSSEVGGVWTSSISRVSGAPAALMVDNADRTHFVGNYVADVALALNN